MDIIMNVILQNTNNLEHAEMFSMIIKKML